MRPPDTLVLGGPNSMNSSPRARCRSRARLRPPKAIIRKPVREVAKADLGPRTWRPIERAGRIRAASSRMELWKARVRDFAPRGLSADEAARYIGVGRTKFDELVAARKMPQPSAPPSAKG